MVLVHVGADVAAPRSDWIGLKQLQRKTSDVADKVCQKFSDYDLDLKSDFESGERDSVATITVC